MTLDPGRKSFPERRGDGQDKSRTTADEKRQAEQRTSRKEAETGQRGGRGNQAGGGGVCATRQGPSQEERAQWCQYRKAELERGPSALTMSKSQIVIECLLCTKFCAKFQGRRENKTQWFKERGWGAEKYSDNYNNRSSILRDPKRGAEGLYLGS